MEALVKVLLISMAAGAVLLGALTFWLPLPIGVPLMLLGAGALVRYSARARTWSERLAQRFPRALGFLRRLSRRP